MNKIKSGKNYSLLDEVEPKSLEEYEFCEIYYFHWLCAVEKMQKEVRNKIKVRC